MPYGVNALNFWHQVELPTYKKKIVSLSKWLPSFVGIKTNRCVQSSLAVNSGIWFMYLYALIYVFVVGFKCRKQVQWGYNLLCLGIIYWLDSGVDLNLLLSILPDAFDSEILLKVTFVLWLTSWFFCLMDMSHCCNVFNVYHDLTHFYSYFLFN